MKCLVVDDSQTMRPIISEAVRRMGIFDVAEFATGHAALSARYSDADLIIASLPEPENTELIGSIRSRTAPGNRPAILVVTTADRLAPVRAELGTTVNGFVLKPFSPDAFRAAVNQVLATPQPQTARPFHLFSPRLTRSGTSA